MSSVAKPNQGRRPFGCVTTHYHTIHPIVMTIGKVLNTLPWVFLRKKVKILDHRRQCARFASSFCVSILASVVRSFGVQYRGSEM